MKIYETHEHVWDIFVLEKEHGLYSIFQKKKRLTSVLQREINCLNREYENHGFRENMDFDLQITCQNPLNKNLK